VLSMVEPGLRRARFRPHEYCSPATGFSLERLAKLRGERAISQDELENTQLALDQARLRLEADTITLDSMRFVKAPFDSIVRIDSTSNSPSISVYPDGGSEVLKNFTEAIVPPINP
jgi:hypothetical protein